MRHNIAVPELYAPPNYHQPLMSIAIQSQSFHLKYILLKAKPLRGVMEYVMSWK